MPASWFWGSISCCLKVWTLQWYKNCPASCVLLPYWDLFVSFASSKACPDCWSTLKKEGLLHTLCHHPNRQRHLLQLWQAVGPCWWTSWTGQLECCRTCSSSLPLEWQGRCSGDKLLQGCSTLPTQQWWGQGWGSSPEPWREEEWSQSHASGWHGKQEDGAGSTDSEEGDTGEESHGTAVTEPAFAGTGGFVGPPTGVGYSQSGTCSV